MSKSPKVVPAPPAPSAAPVTTPARTPLSVDRIAAAALALIDRDGLDGLTMRRLGQDLGVEAMALYHHVPSKGRLLDAVMDRLVLGFDIPAPGSMPALERLRHGVHSYRQIALDHPHAFPLLVGRRFNSAGAFAVYERLLQVFAELGLSPAQAARWFRTLGYFVNGAGMADIASRELTPDATPLQLERAPHDIQFAHVAAVAPHLRVDRLDDVFAFGVDLLLGALAAQAAAPAAPAAPRKSPPSRPANQPRARRRAG
jgi:AcrR family transcriptional regulator